MYKYLELKIFNENCFFEYSGNPQKKHRVGNIISIKCKKVLNLQEKFNLT